MLLKASAVGVQAWRRRGTAGVVDEERGHRRCGALAWGGGRRGAVLRRGAVIQRCSGGALAWGGGRHGTVLRRGVVLRRRGGRGWRGVEMNLDNFNLCLFYTSSSSLPVLIVNRQ